MANSIANKSGVQPVPCDRYVITSSQVIKYLQDQLGFSVGYDFTRWVGVSPDQSYVRMRVVFNPKDLIADSNSTDYVDKVLEASGAGIQFKDTVINTLKPYMFPDNTGFVHKSQDDIDRMYLIGIFGERYEEILRFAKMSYSQQANLFRLYLRPERIIFDMLKDASTDKIDGEASIVRVAGTTSDTIQWLVIVSNKGKAYTSSLDIDTIFKHA